jgi:hypothetical protein
MKKTLKTVSNTVFQIYTGKNLEGKKAMWIDLFGSSYDLVATNPDRAMKFADDLRTMAQWIEDRAEDYLIK